MRSLLLALILFSWGTPTRAQSSDEPSPLPSAPQRDALSGKRRAGDSAVRSSATGAFWITQSESSGEVVGFSFTNTGPNRIIPVPSTEIGVGPDREYHFRFPDRARQDIFFSVTDTPDDLLSNRMESYFYLFPRVLVPGIEMDEATRILRVTLPTGEQMLFDAQTKEILSGPFEETAPLDPNPDRHKRKFAALHYRGTGTLIRVNRRGGDPRLGTQATITRGGKTCKLPSRLLFDPDPHSEVNFLFPTDEAFDGFLIRNCGFGLF